MANLRVANRSGFIRRDGVRRRQMLWLADVWGATNLPAAGSKAIGFSLNAAGLALRPFTVVRSHVEIGFISDQQVATESQLSAYGHVVVTDEAAAIGVTAVPGPALQSASDWHVYQALRGRFTFLTAAGVLLGGERYTIDSRSMRKVDLGETLISVLENSVISDGADIHDFSRVLIKLY